MSNKIIDIMRLAVLGTSVTSGLLGATGIAVAGIGIYLLILDTSRVR